MHRNRIGAECLSVFYIYRVSALDGLASFYFAYPSESNMAERNLRYDDMSNCAHESFEWRSYVDWIGWADVQSVCIATGRQSIISSKNWKFSCCTVYSNMWFGAPTPNRYRVCQFIHFSPFSSRRTSGHCAVRFRYFENSVQSTETMEFVVVDPSIWSTLLLFLLSFGSAALCTETSIKNFISLAHSRRVLVYWNRCVSVVRTFSPSSIYLCERRKQK